MWTKNSQIRLVAGLGNPGPEYEDTRHNIGFLVVDRLAAQAGSTWEKSIKWDAISAKCGRGMLVKPMTYMNRSGEPLRAIGQFYKIDPPEILVVLDDLALPLGRLRLRQRGGPGGHNGLESILVAIWHRGNSAPAYWHRRRAAEASVDYVLSRFFEEEKPLVGPTIDRAAEAVKCAIDNGLVSAMNNFNQAKKRIMKNRYEALLVLNTQGREDNVKEIVDRLESEFQKEGAEIEQVQKMEKRPFSYVAGPTRLRILRELYLSRRSATRREVALEI